MIKKKKKTTRKENRNNYKLGRSKNIATLIPRSASFLKSDNTTQHKPQTTTATHLLFTRYLKLPQLFVSLVFIECLEGKMDVFGNKNDKNRLSQGMAGEISLL